MNKKLRTEIISLLKIRDGFICQFPGCTDPFTEDDPPTIDHWLPRSIYRDESLENLRLMHFRCNNKKGSSIPSADGTIAATRRERVPKQDRPELCNHCKSGRLLFTGEKCERCGIGPQPVSFPTAYKRKPKNCSHSGRDHCYWCVVGIVQRA